jgi:RNA polymerase sigma-70 factor (ECF subfamily)
MDERVFAGIAERYAARLYTVAYRLLRNRADAEDAVQRALLNCFAARAAYSPRWAVSTWLYRVLTNVCVDELRRRQHRAAPAAVEAAEGRSALGSVGAEARLAAERVDLARALERVPREARILLALHYVNGLSHRELASIRGISVNTVKSQLARGKKILRTALDKEN